MIKKLLLISVLCIFVASCGKKGDPKYIESKKSEKKTTLLINKV